MIAATGGNRGRRHRRHHHGGHEGVVANDDPGQHEETDTDAHQDEVAGLRSITPAVPGRVADGGSGQTILRRVPTPGKGTRFLEEVGGTRHHLDAVRRQNLLGRVLVQGEHVLVLTAHDEQGRRVDPRNAALARSARPPRDTTARTAAGRSAAATRALAAPVLAPKIPTGRSRVLSQPPTRSTAPISRGAQQSDVETHLRRTPVDALLLLGEQVEEQTSRVRSPAGISRRCGYADCDGNSRTRGRTAPRRRRSREHPGRRSAVPVRARLRCRW